MSHRIAVRNSSTVAPVIDSLDPLINSRTVFTDVLNPMPEDLTKEIRYFAKCMEPWIKTALEGYVP